MSGRRLKDRTRSNTTEGGWVGGRWGKGRSIEMAMEKKMPTGRDWRCLHPCARDRDDAATPHQPYVVFIAAGPPNTICDLHPWRRDIGVQQWAALLGARLSGGGGWRGRWGGAASWSAYYFSLLYIV